MLLFHLTLVETKCVFYVKIGNLWNAFLRTENGLLVNEIVFFLCTYILAIRTNKSSVCLFSMVFALSINPAVHKQTFFFFGKLLQCCLIPVKLVKLDVFAEYSALMRLFFNENKQNMIRVHKAGGLFFSVSCKNIVKLKLKWN